MNDSLDNYYRDFLARSRKERIVDYAIGAAFIMLLFALAFLVVPLVPVALRQPPIELKELDILTPTGSVCPGDIIEFISHAVVTEPSIIDISVSIVDLETNDIVEGSRMEMGPIPRHISGDYHEHIAFVVPETEPGDYARVTGLTGHNADTNPIFIVIPFTVRNGCEP